MSAAIRRLLVRHHKIAILALSLAAAATSAQQLDAPTRLSPGEPVERSLSPAMPHRYLLTLNSGEFVELRIDQRGIDAVVKVFGLEARQLAEVNDLRNVVGTERVYLLA